jgi:hypothetical protein
MSHKSLYLFSLFAISSMTVLQACKSDNPAAATPQEYVADNSSFIGLSSWPLQKTYHGPDPLLGAMAHANNDSTVVRDVYFKNGQGPVSGKYPVGTIIVKHSHNPAGTVDERTALVKRGNGFNPSYDDWEFFMLAPSGAIMTDSTGMAMRGATLMGGMCGACHSGAVAKDYVFSK